MHLKLFFAMDQNSTNVNVIVQERKLIILFSDIQYMEIIVFYYFVCSSSYSFSNIVSYFNTMLSAFLPLNSQLTDTHRVKHFWSQLLHSMCHQLQMIISSSQSWRLSSSAAAISNETAVQLHSCDGSSYHHLFIIHILMRILLGIQYDDQVFHDRSSIRETLISRQNNNRLCCIIIILCNLV
jgi:hypothetical protein